jgi:hypothetical protein
LIGSGLIDRTDAEIDNRSAHSSTFPVWGKRRYWALPRLHASRQPPFYARHC